MGNTPLNHFNWPGWYGAGDTYIGHPWGSGWSLADQSAVGIAALLATAFEYRLTPYPVDWPALAENRALSPPAKHEHVFAALESIP